MSEIRAFVAHSFTPGDKDLFTPNDQTVVGQFVAILNEIAKLNPNFSWEHAQQAQPREISDKVMSLWSHKSLFIAICTKKEQVISEPDPKLSRGRSRTTWKTSDWIIQEIGFAIGRGCKLILLVENGVRKPGGLQGDLEYIEFERSTPSAAFTKLLQMINNVAPQEKLPMPVRNVSTLQLDKDHAKEVELSNWNTPSESWELRDYEIAFHLATLNKNQQTADRITQSYLNTRTLSMKNKAAWAAFCEFDRIVFGTNGSLQILRDLTTSNPDDEQSFQFLATALEHFDQHEESANTYEIAAEKTLDPNSKIYLLGKAAVQYVRAGKAEFALNDLMDKIRTIASDGSIEELKLLNVLREFYFELKNDDMLLAIIARQVELNPTDVQIRFDLAYRHGGCGNKELSLYHYLKIPRELREASTWNNLGVAYDGLELKAHSVSSYRIAEELGNTLAMSNLANKLLIEGFTEEGKQLCTKALGLANLDSSVLTTIARASDFVQREDEKIDTITRSMLPVDRYYANFGRALIRKNPSQIAGKWKGRECELDIEVDGENLWRRDCSPLTRIL